MKKSLVTLLLVLISIVCFSQINRKTKANENTSGDKEFKSAEFPGGMVEFDRYLHKKMRFPKDAKKQRIDGVVVVQFVIDTVGNVNKESIKVIQPLSESCDREAIRLIQNSPKWIPAVNMTTNRKFETQCKFPIRFRSKRE